MQFIKNERFSPSKFLQSALVLSKLQQKISAGKGEVLKKRISSEQMGEKKTSSHL